jgi:hypothetical protein
LTIKAVLTALCKAVLEAFTQLTKLYSVLAFKPENTLLSCQVTPPSLEYALPITAVSVTLLSVLLSNLGIAGALGLVGTLRVCTAPGMAVLISFTRK